MRANEERGRQEELWNRDHPWGTGDCSSPAVPMIVKAVVLGEECGEVMRAVLDQDDDVALGGPCKHHTSQFERALAQYEEK